MKLDEAKALREELEKIEKILSNVDVVDILYQMDMAIGKAKTLSAIVEDIPQGYLPKIEYIDEVIKKTKELSAVLENMPHVPEIPEKE